MQNTIGRPHGWLTLALLLAASAAAPGARAQTPAAPVYDGFTQTAFVPFHGPNAVQIQVGGRPVMVTMDLGSTGLAITADSIPGYSAEMAAQHPAGWEYLSSSELLWVGRLIPLDVVFPLRGGGSVTANVPVLAVEKEAKCGKDQLDSTGVCTGVRFHRAPGGIHYMGVGFGREHDHQPNGTPDRNPFLNITRIGDTAVPAGAMRSGYVVTGSGVYLGLTAANTAGFRFTPLQLQSPPYDARDWAAPTMCVSVNGSPCTSGSLLTDTGIDYMFLTLPPGLAVDTIPISGDLPLLANGSQVSVRIPEAGEAVGSYTFVTGSGDNKAPCHVTLTSRNPTAFVNTSNRFFREFDLLFDADGGWFGLRPTASPPPPVACLPLETPGRRH